METATRIAEVRSTVRAARDRVRPGGGGGDVDTLVPVVVLGSVVVVGLQIWRLTQIFGVLPSAAAAVGVVATALASIGLWPIARRLGMTALPALGAVLIGAALAVLADVPSLPAGLAVLCLSAAAGLAVLPGRAPPAAVPVALLAVLAAPVTAVALLAMATHMVVTRAVGNGWSSRLRWAVGAGSGAGALLVAVLATGDRPWALAGDAGAIWSPATRTVGFVVVVLTALVTCRRLPWLRPVATATLALSPCALVPGTAGPVLLIAAPATAVLAVAVLDDLLTGDRRRLGAGLGAVLVLLATVPGLVAGARPDAAVGPGVDAAGLPTDQASPPAAPVPVGDTAARGAADWLSVRLDPAYVVAAAPDATARLTGQGFAPERTVPDTPVPDRPYVLVVPADAVVDGTALLARFPDPSGRGLDVRSPAPTGADVERFTADRVRLGETLAANPRLELSPQARDALLAGRVDPRLMTVLDGLAQTYRIGIADPPADPVGPPDAPVSAVTITSVDGARTSDPVVTDVVRGRVSDQNLPVRPELDARPGADLVLRMPVPAPAGP